jgi:hypothetical protein
LVERDYEGNDKDSLLEDKHHKIQQSPSHTSKIVATNNFETLSPWSNLSPKHRAQLRKLEITKGH